MDALHLAIGDAGAIVPGFCLADHLHALELQCQRLAPEWIVRE